MIDGEQRSALFAGEDHLFALAEGRSHGLSQCTARTRASAQSTDHRSVEPGPRADTDDVRLLRGEHFAVVRVQAFASEIRLERERIVPVRIREPPRSARALTREAHARALGPCRTRSSLRSSRGAHNR